MSGVSIGTMVLQGKKLHWWGIRSVRPRALSLCLSRLPSPRTGVDSDAPAPPPPRESWSRDRATSPLELSRRDFLWESLWVRPCGCGRA